MVNNLNYDEAHVVRTYAAFNLSHLQIEVKGWQARVLSTSSSIPTSDDIIFTNISCKISLILVTGHNVCDVIHSLTITMHHWTENLFCLQDILKHRATVCMPYTSVLSYKCMALIYTQHLQGHTRQLLGWTSAYCPVHMSDYISVQWNYLLIGSPHTAWKQLALHVQYICINGCGNQDAPAGQSASSELHQLMFRTSLLQLLKPQQPTSARYHFCSGLYCIHACIQSIYLAMSPFSANIYSDFTSFLGQCAILLSMIAKLLEEILV